MRLYQVFVFCLDVSSSPLLPSCIACKSTFLYLSSGTNSFCALTQIFEQATPLSTKPPSLQFSYRLYCDFYWAKVFPIWCWYSNITDITFEKWDHLCSYQSNCWRKLSAARDFSLNVCIQCTILSIRCKLLLELVCVELRDAGQLIHNVWCALIRWHVYLSTCSWRNVYIKS